jgi:luciferase family oxidoreductase group 1
MDPMTTLSVLDLSPIRAGGDAGQALRNTLDLARAAERLGYERFWVAEHHNMPGIASAATAVVIGYVAQGTSKIRVGAGGVMLPNHAPLVIAEQFGTLESLYPGRIDLGLGRAPGTDQATAHALRRTLVGDVDRFPQDVLELMAYFQPVEPGQRVRAVPGAGLDVPIWILGSSTFGAQLAAALGLPFAFASHFAPEQMMHAIRLYRDGFRPSPQRARSHLMLGFNVLAADTDEDARFLASSAQRAYINRALGLPTQLAPPVHEFEATLSARERAVLDNRMVRAAIGSAQTVQRGLEDFIAETGADELMIATQVYDHAARVRSYEIAAAARDAMNAAAAIPAVGH